MDPHRPLKRSRDTALSVSSLSTLVSLDGPRRLRHLPKRQTTSPPPSRYSKDKYVLRPSLLAHHDSPYDSTDESDSASETDVELGTALSDIDSELHYSVQRDSSRASPEDESEQVDVGLLASAPDSPGAFGDFKFAAPFTSHFPLDIKRKAVDPREYGGGQKKRRIIDVDTTDDEVDRALRPRKAPLKKKRKRATHAARRIGGPTKSIVAITDGMVSLKAQSVIMDVDLPLPPSRYIQRCVKARAGANKRRHRPNPVKGTMFDPFLALPTPVVPVARQQPKASFSRHLSRRSPTSLRPLRTHFRARPHQAVALTGSALVAQILARTQQQKRRRSIVRDFNTRTFAGEWRTNIGKWKTWADLACSLAGQEVYNGTLQARETREEEQVEQQMDMEGEVGEWEETAVDDCLDEAASVMDISPEAVFVPRQVRRAPALGAQLRARNTQQMRNDQALRARAAEQSARVERQARRALLAPVECGPLRLTPSPTPSVNSELPRSPPCPQVAVEEMNWCPPTPPATARPYQLGSPIHLDSERDDDMGVEDLIGSPVLLAPPSPSLSERTSANSTVSDPPEYDVTTYPVSLPVPPHLRPRPQMAERPLVLRSPPQYSRDMLRQYERSPPPPPPYNATTDCQTLVAARFIEDDEDEEREMAQRIHETQTEMRRNAALTRSRRRRAFSPEEMPEPVNRQRMIGAFPSSANTPPATWNAEEVLDELAEDGEQAIEDLLTVSSPGEIAAPRPIPHPSMFFNDSGLRAIDRALGLGEDDEEDQIALAAAVEEHLTDLAVRELEDELDAELVEAERLEAEEELEQAQAGFFEGLGRMWRGVWSRRA